MIPRPDAPLTHRVAVGAYIFHQGRVLLLRRCNPPHVFAPAGGRLAPGEDPMAGILREVLEETGLNVRLVGLAHIWHGSMDGRAPQLLCINYLAESGSAEVTLSDEHSDYLWASAQDISGGRVTTQNEEGRGYRPQDVLMAFDLYARLA